ncbi:imidazolonepropionase-like amidohydrolase [Runella defluvii]|uniref:Imidazolonepropionase-like amidohydrolase n=1 Tax=Runella defluvii TaxID=370973 RepID=A0A7W5ZQE8_9BACT|nr:amidohydrolase family protein [Runella defluvii]MBB3841179.1 imidazolonepropionase-like amidohydrolase [Runella defluvii]
MSLHQLNRIIWIVLLTTHGVVAQKSYLLRPDRIFDGQEIRENWHVLVVNDKIVAVGDAKTIATVTQSSKAEIIDLKGCTLLPGFIEGHSHLFLHPYNETTWDDQVLKEARSLRTSRAVVHAKKTLMAGFTTVRDLGTEGAEFDDVGLKQAIQQGIIPGPRMIIATKALIATGSYAPKGFSTDVTVPQGAEEADGRDPLIRAVRNQIGKGADVIKIYADYRWGLMGEARPTFLIDEIKLIVETAQSSGRPVIAHAGSVEGMRRAILGGCETLEHGDAGTPEIFALMKEKGVALCPTLAAGDAITQYRGWKKGIEPEPERIKNKRKTFQQALDAGVTICFGGDVGVFTHGDNVREMEMMVDYGMKPLDVLRSATSVNARVFHQEQLGQIKTGFLADLVAVEGRPDLRISDVRNVKLVIKNGEIQH